VVSHVVNSNAINEPSDPVRFTPMLLIVLLLHVIFLSPCRTGNIVVWHLVLFPHVPCHSSSQHLAAVCHLGTRNWIVIWNYSSIMICEKPGSHFWTDSHPSRFLTSVCHDQKILVSGFPWHFSISWAEAPCFQFKEPWMIYDNRESSVRLSWFWERPLAFGTWRACGSRQLQRCTGTEAEQHVYV
jgi:hypothetical protein